MEMEEERGERQLAQRWSGLRADAPLVTQEGEALKVRFPGLPNSGAGPDFLGAVLVTERGRVVRGDVELHQTSRGWRAHGHQEDSRYARVVLHVVGRDDAGGPTELPSGGRAPVLELGPPESDAESAAVLCSSCGHGGGRSDVLPVLEAQGMLRFALRTRRLERSIRALGPDQAFYYSLFSALGVGSNRPLYQRLAQGLPWSVVQERLQAGGEAPHTATQSLLLGAGGLLEAAPPKGVQAASWQRLRDLWRGWHLPVVVPSGQWRRAGRPLAQPWLRLAGAATLLARWREHGPARHLTQWTAGLEPETPPKQWRAPFTVSGLETGLSLPWAAIGHGRADALIVNVLFPYLVATEGLGEDHLPQGLALEAYRRYTSLEPDSVVRGLAQRLGLSPGGLTVCQQQGLHHLHRWYCARGRQGKCPLRSGGLG